MSIQDDETLKMYVEESQEHLADIENDLLAIEDGGAEIDEDLVNRVFRAAHSIKGGAGFMGLNTIKELSHKIENVLGMIRSREIVPNSEIINILLVSFDKLRELIGNVDASNEIDINEHCAALTELTVTSLPKEEQESVTRMLDIRLPEGETVFKVPEFDLLRAKKEGKSIYLIEYDLIQDVQNKDKSPLDILSMMQESGTILECKIDVAAVGNLEEDEFFNRIPFLVLFASIAEPDIINSLMEVDGRKIRQIDEDFKVKPVEVLSPGMEEESSEAVSPSAQPLIEKSESGAAGEEEDPSGNDDEAELLAESSPPSSVKDEEEGISSSSRKPMAKAKAVRSDSSLRVHVSLLDNLMTLAGELVLSRNQLLQAITSDNRHSLEQVGQRVDMITSELQETIMFTRMQPIGNIFNKFPRVVRDLSKALGKKVDLFLEGKEVELDKTIIEGLSDPLTHLVRNSVDHGVESPDLRKKAGKDPNGKVVLKAYHEAGQVNIEIIDNGKGIDGDMLAKTAVNKGLITEEQSRVMSEKEKNSLIFLPGFSTAKEVTDVSGRGVGMDVVKTNLDKLGGVVDIETQKGKGTTISIKLPLTLAIIPSQVVSAGKERYAIPQVNLDELLRIPADQVLKRIEIVGDAEVVRLRGQLLPLLRLTDVLGIKRTFIDQGDKKEKPDRRKTISGRRAVQERLGKDDSSSDEHDADLNRRDFSEKRYQAGSAVNITVVSAGAFKYGLVVDKFYDSEEIVVKPLGRHLKGCSGYAGATIMGDGRVALILDVPSLARMAQLTSLEGSKQAAEAGREAVKSREDVQSLLIFRNAEDEQFAVPLGLVSRIEKIKRANLELVSGKRVIQYRGATLPLVSIDEVANVKSMDERDNLGAVVFKLAGKEIGLLANSPIDAVEISERVDEATLRQTGIMGSVIIEGQTTLMVDIFGLVETINPEWFEEREAVQVSEGKAATILFAEDSNFFRSQVKGFMEDDGYRIIEAEDGVIAWDLLQEHAEDISLVVTDIEMPNLDGFGLTKKIREDDRFSGLPVIALTTLAGEEDVARGKEVGIDYYQIKLDKEKLMGSVYECLQREVGH